MVKEPPIMAPEDATLVQDPSILAPEASITFLGSSPEGDSHLFIHLSFLRRPTPLPGLNLAEGCLIYPLDAIYSSFGAEGITSGFI